MLTIMAMAKRVVEMHGGKLAVEERVEATA
jgi:signal transduction histidine kinase